MDMRTRDHKMLETPVALEIRGRRWLVSPPRPADLVALDAHMRINRDPLTKLADDPSFARFSPEIQRALAVEALRLREVDMATSLSVAVWVNSPLGVTFLLWRLVRRQHPEFDVYDKFRALYDPEDPELALGFDELEAVKSTIDRLTPAQKKSGPTRAPEKRRKK